LARLSDAGRSRTPTDDELDLLEVSEIPGGVVAGYAWRARPSVRAGEMRFRLRAGRIAQLVVTFDA